MIGDHAVFQRAQFESETLPKIRGRNWKRAHRDPLASTKFCVPEVKELGNTARVPITTSVSPNNQHG